MGQWRYKAHGGVYTVGENALRADIVEGRLNGIPRIDRVEDNTSHRVDTTFPLEYRAAMAESARKRSRTSKIDGPRRSSIGGYITALAVLFCGVLCTYIFLMGNNLINAKHLNTILTMIGR